MRLELTTTTWLVIDLVNNELSLETKPKNDINGLPIRYPICHQLTSAFIKALRSLPNLPKGQDMVFTPTSFSGTSSIRLEYVGDVYSMNIKLDGMRGGVYVKIPRDSINILIDFLGNVIVKRNNPC